MALRKPHPHIESVSSSSPKYTAQFQFQTAIVIFCTPLGLNSVILSVVIEPIVGALRDICHMGDESN